MMEINDWIGQAILNAIIFISILFLFLRFFLKNWIKYQFNKNLEQAKSEISFYATERLSLHNKEYEVFPEIWSRLIDAEVSLQAALMEFRTMPDLNSMEDDNFKKWLGRIDLEDDEKDAMLEADDRMSLFNRILDRRHLRKAEEAFLEFQMYLQKNRIFLSPEIKERFDKIKDLLRKAWAARTTDVRLQGQASHVDFLDKALDILNDEVEPLMLEIENIIQGKLFPKRETNSR